ncbi:hypothetical protein D3C81_1434290 [compost metagenome]
MAAIDFGAAALTFPPPGGFIPSDAVKRESSKPAEAHLMVLFFMLLLLLMLV